MSMSEWIPKVEGFVETYIMEPLSNFSLSDALDILLLTVVLYCVILFFSERRAGKLAVGVGCVLVVYIFSRFFDMRSVQMILNRIAPFIVVLVAVVFQPEIREGLERLGDVPFAIFVRKRNEAEIDRLVSEVVEAAVQITQAPKDGALIVIERSTPLGDFVKRGHEMDAMVSAGLLRNIFVDKTPLHDGAVIIRRNRISAACCELPLTTNEDVVNGLGSRHRAAVGITEVSDCVVVVVSEQRHTISIANNGYLKRNYNQKPEDFLNEYRTSTIKGALVKDLRRLLGNTKRFGTAEEEEQQQRMGILPEIRFTWCIKKKSRSDENNQGRFTAADKEPEKPSRTKGKQYRVTGKFIGRDTENDSHDSQFRP